MDCNCLPFVKTSAGTWQVWGLATAAGCVCVRGEGGGGGGGKRREEGVGCVHQGACDQIVRV